MYIADACTIRRTRRVDATARGKRSNLRNQGPAVRDPSSRHEEEWKTKRTPRRESWLGGEQATTESEYSVLRECVCQSYEL